jgi:hypothetical protein
VTGSALFVETRAGYRARVDRVNLEAVLRATGTLPPAAVCRIGRDVAHALVDLHGRSLVGSPSASTIYVDVRGALLFPSGSQGTASDDLFALGAVLAEAALGHALGAAAGIRTLGSGLPDRLVDAIEVLTGPPEMRVTNAGAAERVFSEIEKLYGDGAALLAIAVERAHHVRALRDTSPPRTMEMESGAVLSREDLRRLAEPAKPPVHDGVTQAMKAGTPPLTRDTMKLPDDVVLDGATTRVPRAVYFAVGALGVVALLFLAFALGNHFAK